MSDQPFPGSMRAVFATPGSGEQGHPEPGPAFRPVPSTDPGVLQRLLPEGEDPPSQVITAFAPAEERPASYPAALPFLPGVPTWTTEYPTGEQPPGARWSAGEDPDAIVAALLERSVAAGWSRVDTGLEFPSPLPAQQIALRRGEWARLLIAVHVGTESIVQLLDLPASLLNSRRAPG